MASACRPAPAAFSAVQPLRAPHARAPSAGLCARRRPRCCAAAVRPDLPVVRAPMTGGADVLFPGGSQLLRLVGDEAGVAGLHAAAAAEPPVFAFSTVDAWGGEADVGTLAVIDEMRTGGEGEEGEVGAATVLCSGLGRWRRGRGGVEEFWDDAPAEADGEALRVLDEEVVGRLMELVRLSIKVSGMDVGRETALAETMKRMEALCAKVDGGEGGAAERAAPGPGGADGTGVLMLQHWVGVRDDVNRRRELLGFITLDLISLSFMERVALLESTNTKLRLQMASDALDPLLKELAAKAAIVSAFGADGGRA